jgi:hypothetical protein
VRTPTAQGGRVWRAWRVVDATDGTDAASECAAEDQSGTAKVHLHAVIAELCLGWEYLSPCSCTFHHNDLPRLKPPHHLCPAGVLRSTGTCDRQSQPLSTKYWVVYVSNLTSAFPASRPEKERVPLTKTGQSLRLGQGRSAVASNYARAQCRRLCQTQAQ